MLAYLRHISFRAIAVPLVVGYVLPALAAGLWLGEFRTHSPRIVIYMVTKSPSKNQEPDIVLGLILLAAYFVAIAPFAAAGVAGRSASALPLLHGLLVGSAGCLVALSVLPVLTEMGLWWVGVSIGLSLFGAAIFRRPHARE